MITASATSSVDTVNDLLAYDRNFINFTFLRQNAPQYKDVG